MMAFDQIKKVVFGGYVEDADYNNYHFMKVGTQYVAMYKGQVIFQVADKEVVVEEPQTKANEKVIDTFKMVLDM